MRARRALTRVIRIERPDDPRVEPYRAVRERDLAGRHGVFVAEGEGVVRALLSPRSRFRAASVLASEARAKALGAWLEGLAVRLPVMVASRAVMDAIVGFPIHRGLLALGRRGDDPTAASVLPPPDRPALVLALVGLANHDNVGGIMRNAAAFGVDAVLLDATSCDPLYRKSIRVSVGAALSVPFARGGSAEALVASLVEAGFGPLALTPSGETAVEDLAWPARAALVVGSEGEGLPAGLLRQLPTVRIGMAPGFDSLNVATASGIALHAASLARRPAREERTRR